MDQDDRLSIAMIKTRSLQPKLAIGFILAITLDTAVQLLWKMAVVNIPEYDLTLPSFMTILSNPLFIVVVGLMGIQFLNWLLLLAHTDLSYAQPVTSLSYVTVCILSVVLLNEKIDQVQCVGIALVVAGVWFISQTGHVTPSEGDAR
jgi:drug/metabolite transporter (DMT)-like permease